MIHIIHAVLVSNICSDLSSSCSVWAEDGECRGKLSVVITSCPAASCGICGSECHDNHTECSSWAHSGECSAIMTLCLGSVQFLVGFVTPSVVTCLVHVKAIQM